MVLEPVSMVLGPVSIMLESVSMHGACGGCVPGLACHKGSVNGNSWYSDIGRHTKKF